MNANENTRGIVTESVSRMTCPHCNAELDVSEFKVFEEIACPACGKTVTVPGRLEHFLLMEELGGGGMGTVFFALDEHLNRMVALKVIRKEYAEDEARHDALLEKAGRMAALNHANVVHLYSFGETNDQPYFVFELMQGERLDDRLASGESLPENLALSIGLDAARGLAAADMAGIAHGNLKPSNLLLNKKGVAKVVDFGMAAFMESGDESVPWGTPPYTAPEQLHFREASATSDQYSLGVILFHALTGSPPPENAPPALEDFPPGLQPQTVDLVTRLLRADPGERFSGLDAAAKDLESALAAAEQAEAARLEAERAEREARKNQRPNLLAPILSGVALFILVVVAGVVWLQTRGPRAQEVEYTGPRRELHRPFVRVEENTLELAVGSLRENKPEEVRERLQLSARHIPEEHAVNAWYHFLGAGLLLYAGETEVARAWLETAANLDPILFDGGGFPAEDPRLLAQLALGIASERDLERALRRAEPYFVHMADLARAYASILQGSPREARPHLSRYAAHPPAGGLRWPYLLQSIAPALAEPRPRMTILEEASPAEVVTRPPVVEPVPPPRTVPTPTPPSPPAPEPGVATLSQGLITHWSLTQPRVLPPRGRLEGDARWVADERFGQALRLDGQSGRMETPLHAPYSLPAISFAFWLHPDPPDGTARNIFSQKTDDPNQPEGYLFSIYTRGDGTLAVRIGAREVNTGVRMEAQWNHLVVVFDGLEDADRLRVYLNEAERPAWRGPLPGVDRVPRPTEVTAAMRPDQAPGRWKGRIGGVRVYNRVLLPNEITLLAGENP